MTAVLMVLGLALPAMAAGALPPEAGNLYIHKYVMEDGRTPGAPNDGTQIPSPAGAVPLNGIAFNLYRVDTGEAPAAGMAYRLDGPDLEAYDASGALAATYPVVPAAAPRVTTAGDGSAMAAGLPQGFYLVVEDLAGSRPVSALDGTAVVVGTACAPFVVAVPMTSPAGDGWLEDVHVYPKNEALGIEKEAGVADGDAIAVGDTVPYTITSTVPQDIAASKRYDVTDVLDPALTFDEGSVTVTARPGGTVLDEGADYTVTHTGGALTVSLTAAGRARLAGHAKAEVSFTTTVNDGILSKEGYTVGNEASVGFTNEDGEDYEADTGGEGPEVHTAAINITKVDQSGAPLDGAAFKVASSKENAEAGRFLRIDGDNVVYDTGDDGYAALDDYEVSPDNKAAFMGLKDSVDGAWQAYWVVEAKAPAGYNLLDRPIQVAFDGTEAGFTYELTVQNSQGFTLPKTGGTGTIVFTVIGIALLGGAVIVAASRKRTAPAADGR